MPVSDIFCEAGDRLLPKQESPAVRCPRSLAEIECIKTSLDDAGIKLNIRLEEIIERFAVLCAREDKPNDRRSSIGLVYFCGTAHSHEFALSDMVAIANAPVKRGHNPPILF